MQTTPIMIPGADPVRAARAKTSRVKRSAPVFAGTLHAVDTVHFSGKQTDAQKVSAETTRLKGEDRASLVKAAYTQIPVLFFRNFSAPTPLMLSLRDFRGWYKAYRGNDHSYEPRALYNVTGQAAHLNQYLPYRRLLTEQGDVQALQRYDQLVEKISRRIEFLEGDLGKFNEEVSHLYAKEYAEDVKEYLRDHPGPIDPFHDEGYLDLGIKHLARVKEEELARIAASTLKPIADPSSRYVLAAQIAELFRNHPEYIDQVLDREPFQGDRHPLRMVVGVNAPITMAAAYQNMLNLIFINRPNMWLSQYGGTPSQHEFVHAFSVQDGKVGGTLPVMTEAQKERFGKARTELFEQYDQHEDTFLGRMMFWLTGKTSTGLPNYAFFNNAEFLTVTLDAFKMGPDRLCQTDPGKEVYAVYKEIFGLDPLEDYKGLQRRGANAETPADESTGASGLSDDDDEKKRAA